MTEEKNERNNLIRHRIKEAEETIEDVKILVENNRLRAAVKMYPPSFLRKPRPRHFGNEAFKLHRVIFFGPLSNPGG